MKSDVDVVLSWYQTPDSLTRVLVALYEEPENPEDALEYIKQFLGSPQGVDVESLQRENEELEKKAEELRQKLAELKEQQTEATAWFDLYNAS